MIDQLKEGIALIRELQGKTGVGVAVGREAELVARLDQGGVLFGAPEEGIARASEAENPISIQLECVRGR